MDQHKYIIINLNENDICEILTILNTETGEKITIDLPLPSKQNDEQKTPEVIITAKPSTVPLFPEVFSPQCSNNPFE